MGDGKEQYGEPYGYEDNSKAYFPRLDQIVRVIHGAMTIVKCLFPGFPSCLGLANGRGLKPESRIL
jgi:hypothetical protein